MVGFYETSMRNQLCNSSGPRGAGSISMATQNKQLEVRRDALHGTKKLREFARTERSDQSSFDMETSENRKNSFTEVLSRKPQSNKASDDQKRSSAAPGEVRHCNTQRSARRQLQYHLREEGTAQFGRGDGAEWHQLVSAPALLGVSSAPTVQKQNPSVTADTSCRMLCDVCGKFVEIARIACCSKISMQPNVWKIDPADQLIGEF
ncbi:hypothetical protein Y032_0061g3204 [Ancylostoma ceylanicum]|uniref:Uncharacterized protein n=1 Tax=Ancylostoma ceylanicum TaxID=53326 RepID=A0A016U1M6_9BILA|nr:hypothetical protein Y032_0061g3204 [Ancylostoma ceylanicum]